MKHHIAQMEIVDIQDGTSNTIFFGERPPSRDGGSGNDFLNSGFGNDVMMGIVPGQTLRINVFHPSDGQKGATSVKTVAVKVTLSDLGGNVIAQTTASAIPEGEFRSFDFNRYALPLPGEPGTGRLQVRARLEVSEDPKATTLLVPSLELIDNSGRTAAAGKRFIIFVTGPRPFQQ